MDSPDAKTMLQVLHAQAARRGQQPAFWSRREHGYVPTSWREYADRVKRFALGLHALGLRPHAALGILSFNREEWVVADLVAMALRAVPVGLYTTSSPEQVQYILAHCEAELVVVENLHHLGTVQAVRGGLPRLRHIILLDPPAGGAPLPEGVLTYAEVLARGTGVDEAPYREGVEAAAPDELATLIYTSGTTGHPKGVMLSHHNLTWTARQLTRAAGLAQGGALLSYLPLSHIAEQILTIHGALTVGAEVYFAPSIEAVPEALKEVRPTLFFAVPRVWEKFKARAEQGLLAQSPLRQQVVAWARRTATARHARALRHERVSPWLEAQYRLAQRLVFRPLKARIGFDRVELFAVSAAPIGLGVLEFFASLDIVIREVYGQSEVTGPTSVSTPDATRLGALGHPMLGVEVRIAEDGEILVRGDNVCLGYYKSPESTAELLEGGWLHSGDLGRLDEQGYLHVTGRKKEILVTSGGKKTSPANIEALLKALPGVGHALVVG
ncbi:MAG TPA: AMP-binding protein, partial [Aggregicoccus sp.]|nr:AMP-binding protein [Aggregicoccus sp.]